MKPTRSASRDNPCPSRPAGTYTSTTRTDGSPSILLLRAWLSIVTRVTPPIGPENLRMRSYPWLLLISSGEIITQDPLGQLDRGGFWSFLPLGYVDVDALSRGDLGGAAVLLSLPMTSVT